MSNPASSSNNTLDGLLTTILNYLVFYLLKTWLTGTTPKRNAKISDGGLQMMEGGDI